MGERIIRPLMGKENHQMEHENRQVTIGSIKADYSIDGLTNEDYALLMEYGLNGPIITNWDIEDLSIEKMLNDMERLERIERITGKTGGLQRQPLLTINIHEGVIDREKITKLIKTCIGTDDLLSRGIRVGESPWTDDSLSRESVSRIRLGKDVKIKNAKGLFSYMPNVQEIDIHEADFSESTDMSSMFSNDFALESLNMNGIDTSRVRDTSWMFESCYRLKNIDLTELDLSSLIRINEMFLSCLSLEHVEFPENAGNVFFIHKAFADCLSLKTIDLTPLRLGKSHRHRIASLSRDLFKNCVSLHSIEGLPTDLPTEEGLDWFAPSRVLDRINNDWYKEEKELILGEFAEGAIDLDLAGILYDLGCYNYGNSDRNKKIESARKKELLESINNGTWAIPGCSSLRTVNGEPVKRTNDSNSFEFNGVKSIVNDPDIPGPYGVFAVLDAPNEDSDLWLSYNCGWGPGRAFYFNDQTGALDIRIESSPEAPDILKDQRGFLREYLEDFFNATGINPTDLHSIEIGHGFKLERDLSRLFKDMTGLNKVIFHEPLMRNVADCTELFSGCDSLKTVMFIDPNFSTDYFKNNVYGHSDNPGITYAYGMFKGCKKLFKLDLSGLDFTGVKNMENMLDGCTGLKYLNLPAVMSRSLYKINCMFNKCQSLESINLEDWNTPFLRGFHMAFRGCSSLRTLILPKEYGRTKTDGPSTIKVTRALEGCTSLTKDGIVNDYLCDWNLH